MKRLIIGSEIIKFDEIGSTNRYLSKLCKERELKDGTVIATGFQTAGRGQDTNTWYSSAGKNLLFSIFIKTGFIKTEDQFMLNKFVSLGILDYLKTLIDISEQTIKIKWPNDIYIGNKKVGGILIQNQIQGSFMDHTIVGIGLNINESKFPSEIPNPVSIYQLTGKKLELSECIQNLLDALDLRYQQMFCGVDESIHSEYLQSLFRFNKMHRYRIGNEIRSAKIKGITEFGKLILEFNEGSKEFDLKEVEFLYDDHE